MRKILHLVKGALLRVLSLPASWLLWRYGYAIVAADDDMLLEVASTLEAARALAAAVAKRGLAVRIKHRGSVVAVYQPPDGRDVSVPA